jgi:hypothetical protein
MRVEVEVMIHLRCEFQQGVVVVRYFSGVFAFNHSLIKIVIASPQSSEHL